MNRLKVSIVLITIAGLISSFAFAAGDAAKGKILFNDPNLGKAGKSCNSCHPDGKGLGKAVDTKDLAKVINACIEKALRGNSIDPESAEMADFIAYIRSLKGR